MFILHHRYYKKYAVNKLSVLNRARHGPCGPERCMIDVSNPFNLTLLQKYELTCKYFYL